MCRHVVYLLQRRVAPQAEIVVWVAVRGQDLLGVRGPLEGCDLGCRVEGGGPGARRGGPKVDVLIGRSASCGQERALPWTPRESLF